MYGATGTLDVITDHINFQFKTICTYANTTQLQNAATQLSTACVLQLCISYHMRILNVTGFAKRDLICPIINIQKYVFEIFNLLYVSQECMELLICISPLIYSHPRPFSEWTLQWMASSSACLFDCFIYQLVNTTSTSIRVVGSHKVVGSHDVAGSYNSKIFVWPNGINSGCFQPH